MNDPTTKDKEHRREMRLFPFTIHMGYRGYKCKHFGCGKDLTLEEVLFGQRCHDHQQEIKPINLIDYYLSK